MLKFLNIQTQKLSAKIMTGAMIGSGLFANAASASDFDAYATNVTGSVNTIPQIINFVCYAGGAGMCGLGLLGVKQHVDDPNSVKLKQPVAKLLIGGSLLAFPALTTVITGTADGGASGNVTFDSDAFDDLSI